MGVVLGLRLLKSCEDNCGQSIKAWRPTALSLLRLSRLRYHFTGTAKLNNIVIRTALDHGVCSLESRGF